MRYGVARILVCWIILASGVVFNGCAPSVTKPATETVRVFVSGDLEMEELSRLARMVAQEKTSSPVLWLAGGKVFSADLNWFPGDGEEEVTVIGRAGVDAVLFNPDWLTFGVPRIKELVDRAPFRVIAVNLYDTLNMPVVHPWLTRKLGVRNLGVVFGLEELPSPFSSLQGIKIAPLTYELQKVKRVIQNRTDLLVLLLREGDSLAAAGFDLVLRVPERGANLYELTFAGNKVVDFNQRAISVAGFEPDPNVLAVIDAVKQEMAEWGAQVVVESRVKIPPLVLSRALVSGFLGLRAVDCFIYDSTALVRETIPAGTITRRMLVSALSEPGRLAFVQLDGKEINLLTKKYGLFSELRGGLPVKRIMANKVYRTALPLTFLKKFPELAGKEFTLSERCFWDYAVDILQAHGKR